MRPAEVVRRGVMVAVLLVSVLAVQATVMAAEPLFGRMETEEGNILLVFYPELAPHHVENFVHLSRTGFYDGTRFHRIVPGFVIQGGDPNSKDADPRNDGIGGPKMTDVLTAEELATVNKVNEMLDEKGYVGLDGPANLKNEFSQTAKHTKGTLSMARNPSGPDTAGSQFFICTDDTPQLDGQYTIFGHVVLGQEVADKIVSAETNPAAGRQAPAVPVMIKHIAILEGTGGLTPDEQAAWAAMPATLKSVK